MKETSSRKKVIIISAICLIIALVAVIVVVALISLHNQNVKISFTQEIKVADEKAEPEMHAYELPILQKGIYSFHVEWQAQQPSFVSGCVIKNEQGQVVFAVTGDTVAADSVKVKLDKQIYTVEVHYLANEQEYTRFITNYFDTDAKPRAISEFESEGIGNDGTFLINYTIEARRRMNAVVIGVCAGIIIGIICVVLLWALTKTGESAKCKFDERQELVRGRGFKYGFFTLLICNGMMCLLKMLDAPMYAEPEVVLVINCLIGIGVYVVYCIWNEGYFALNENRKRLMIAFAFIGVSNLLISAGNIAKGTIFENGRLTFYSLNLWCGLLFGVIFITLLLKKICKDGKEEQV